MLQRRKDNVLRHSAAQWRCNERQSLQHGRGFALACGCNRGPGSLATLDNMLQRRTTGCNAGQQVALQDNRLQRRTTCCNAGQHVATQGRALRASSGATTAVLGSHAVVVRAPCADESRRSRRITPSCSSSSARSSWRRPSSRWRRVATALPPRCAVLQHGALRFDVVVCCGKHVLLQQTTEEESAVVAEQKERQVTTGYSRVVLGVLYGCF